MSKAAQVMKMSSNNRMGQLTPYDPQKGQVNHVTGEFFRGGHRKAICKPPTTDSVGSPICRVIF